MVERPTANVVWTRGLDSPQVLERAGPHEEARLVCVRETHRHTGNSRIALSFRASKCSCRGRVCGKVSPVKVWRPIELSEPELRTPSPSRTVFVSLGLLCCTARNGVVHGMDARTNSVPFSEESRSHGVAGDLTSARLRSHSNHLSS